MFCVFIIWMDGNTGAAWGMLSGKTFLFVIFTLVAIAFIVKIMSNIFRLMRSDKKHKTCGSKLCFCNTYGRGGWQFD